MKDRIALASAITRSYRNDHDVNVRIRQLTERYRDLGRFESLEDGHEDRRKPQVTYEA